MNYFEDGVYNTTNLQPHSFQTKWRKANPNWLVILTVQILENIFILSFVRHEKNIYKSNSWTIMSHFVVQ